MMPQREMKESTKGQADSTYGRYEGEREYGYQQAETSYQQPLREGPVDKLYVPIRDNTNMLRLIMFVMAMVALIVFAVICLLIVGGTGGWISFCAACGAVFLIAVMAIEKIK